ncbi:hypothetical protein [Haladaptatus sp. DYF46]|uniref:hypothetical protein n=1 Tax=Haladaptatus sp. DYF46 TaxID=2886041 RepID=UPI001E32AFFF|nr:hypothetical protein [Haladaptatus sp. DYF46]
MRRIRSHPRDVFLPVGALVGIILTWWGIVVIGGIPPYLLPSPVAVFERLLNSPDLYLRNARITFDTVAVGGTIGIVLGGGLGALIATVPWFRRTIYPYLVAARVVPKIAVAPVLLIYIGTGFSTAVVFVAFASSSSAESAPGPTFGRSKSLFIGAPIPFSG